MIAHSRPDLAIPAQHQRWKKLRSAALHSAISATALWLSGCQVPGEQLKPPPVFTNQPLREAQAAEAPFSVPREPLGSQTDTLGDFLKFAGSDTVTFAPRSAELSPAAREILARQATWLAARPAVAILIEGHSDERVSVPEAFALSEQRAHAVRRFLAANGVAAARIRLVAFGKTKPRAAARDEAAWQANRRATTLPILEPVRESRP